jgi:hypothetical protein
MPKLAEPAVRRDNPVAPIFARMRNLLLFLNSQLPDSQLPDSQLPDSQLPDSQLIFTTEDTESTEDRQVFKTRWPPEYWRRLIAFFLQAQRLIEAARWRCKMPHLQTRILVYPKKCDFPYSRMDSSMIAAFSAILGTTVGGLTTFLTTFLNQRYAAQTAIMGVCCPCNYRILIFQNV